MGLLTIVQCLVSSPADGKYDLPETNLGLSIVNFDGSGALLRLIDVMSDIWLWRFSLVEEVRANGFLFLMRRLIQTIASLIIRFENFIDCCCLAWVDGAYDSASDWRMGGTRFNSHQRLTSHSFSRYQVKLTGE